MLYAEKEILKPWCVLIIDDSPDDRAEIRRMLLKGSDRRLSFMEAGTAAAGIKAVLDAVLPPDCLVLDYNLPDMDAPEVLVALAGPDGMPVCPVLVITGGTNREHGRRALRAGAQDYFGKDWTNPRALTRAVENACEIWTMARGLRQREDALRRVIDRETFRNAFRYATRDLRDELVVKRVASRLLGEYLKVNRVMYGEVTLSTGTIAIGSSYVSGVRQIEGHYSLNDYGPKLLTTLMSGSDIVASYIPGDGAYSETEKSAYAQMDICANLAIPILKNGKLAAVLGIHQKTRRDWTSEDLLIAREIGERTWAAVEHARTEMSLLAKEVQLSQMMQIMPSFSAVLTGPTFVFQLANQAYFDVVGRGSEILGQTILDVFPELIGQPFPALLEEVYRTGKPFEAKSMAVSLRRGPGRSLVDIFVDFAYLPLRDPDDHVSGIFMHGVDRTAEVQATQALAWRERELRSLTGNIPIGLARFDRQHRFVFVNSVVENMASCPMADLLGQTIHKLGLPEPLRGECDLALQCVFGHNGPRDFDFALPGPQGLRHFSCRMVPEFDESGQVEFVLAVIHDITEKKLIDRILLDKNIELENAMAVAEKANLAKSEFLSSMSHELRTPLNSILGFAQLLESGMPEPTANQQGRIEQILKAGWYLLELVNEILDLSIIESGQVPLAMEPVALASLMLECQSMVDPIAQDSAIAVHYPALDHPGWVWADHRHLKQILINLLSNAIKYNRSGGSLEVTCSTVPSGRLRVSVHDTGRGLSAEQLTQLFQPFNRLGQETGTIKGTGIGLVVSKRLIELMGGEIGANSTVGVGSVFWFELPETAASAQGTLP